MPYTQTALITLGNVYQEHGQIEDDDGSKALPVHPEVLRKSFLFREDWNGEDSKTEEYSNQTQKSTFQEKSSGRTLCPIVLTRDTSLNAKWKKCLTAQSIFDRTWHVLKVLLSGFAVVVESRALFPKGEAGSAILL